MTQEQFLILYPRVIAWINQTLADHSSNARYVASLGFSRLPQYFAKQTLASTKVISVDRVPTPPLSQLGASGFGELENMDAGGITYLDTFFVNQRCAKSESLHFHELIHVIQWRLLKPQRFVAAYAEGIERFGYRNSPLEAMAYDMQARFETSLVPFNAEQEVADAFHIAYAE